MKTLKKFLLIGLFSFTFILNVSAEESFPDYYNFNYYNSAISSYINLSDEEKKEFVNNLESMISFNNDYQYYFNVLQIVPSTNTSFSIRRYSSNEPFRISANYTKNNTSAKNLHIFSSLVNGMFIETFSFNCQTAFNECSLTNSTSSTGTYISLTNLAFNYELDRFIYGTNQDTFEYITLPNFGQTGYDFTISLNNINSFSIDNQKTFNLGDEIPSSELIGNFYTFTSTSYNYVGTFENSEVITYKINDIEPGTNKELSLKFTFLNELDITSDDISIYKYGSQIYTSRTMTCSNVNNNSICEFNLKYDVSDSNDDKLMFDFKFDKKYNVQIEDSTFGNGIYSNYKDVEYEYKQINFKDLSGAVFYLRNYDNFKYMSSYFDKDFFKFVISSDFDWLGGDVIYPNDIEYKNNYIFNDENDITQIDTTNLNKLNNFSRKDIAFELDETLLNDNKYSSFLIVNKNYLGSGDTDNQNLYLYYNSSLFNINKLKYSVMVNNGSTNNYLSTENDFNFTVNGSQESSGGGVNSGFIFEFDEEIKVHYKRGLEYFKDKIIDIFEFVSEFYNTMPEKFRVAFSLIFVLLIGIVLFRLLL